MRLVEFEWDQTKRLRTIAERAVDVVYASLIFEGCVLTTVDDRREYGEERLISLGMVGDEFFVVVHTAREGSIRLITAWKGGRNDRKRYEASFARRDKTNEGEG